MISEIVEHLFANDCIVHAPVSSALAEVLSALLSVPNNREIIIVDNDWLSAIWRRLYAESNSIIIVKGVLMDILLNNPSANHQSCLGSRIVALVIK